MVTVRDASNKTVMKVKINPDAHNLQQHFEVQSKITLQKLALAKKLD